MSDTSLELRSGLPADLASYLISFEKRLRLPPLAKFHFPNGYGASVILLESDPSLTLELAVWSMDEYGEWAIDYSTPLTNDVERYDNFAEVCDVLRIIRDWPAK